MLAAMKSLYWHEVALRDGLQNEAKVLPLEHKLQLMQHLVAAKPDSIEITSFVRPDRVPQLADAEDLCRALPDQEWVQKARAEGMQFTGLAANMRGLERLLQADLDSVTMVVSATESHSKSNVGMTKAQAAATAEELIRTAKQEGLFVRSYLSMSYVCPFEGPVEPQPVLDLLQALHEWGADVLLPADTLGSAEPQAVGKLLGLAQDLLPDAVFGMHLHNTHGRALENCQVAWERGVRYFDAAAGGTGGCPFAPGAAGNLDSASFLEWAASNGADVPWDPNQNPANSGLAAAEALLREQL